MFKIDRSKSSLNANKSESGFIKYFKAAVLATAIGLISISLLNINVLAAGSTINDQVIIQTEPELNQKNY